VSGPHSRRKLPPLNAVCAFEACARLGSTVAAASELGVTHGAVSKQIALLESWLELPLFDRSGVRLTPTAAGARFAAALGRSLDGIDAATRSLTDAASDAGSVVRVSTTSSFAALWLLPRLGRFRAQHPGIEVWVSESKAPAEVSAGGVDLALRTGRGPWPGVRAEPLLTDQLVPACSPDLARQLRQPADLARAALLHDQDPGTAWPDWLEAAGLGRPAWAGRGPRVADGALLLQAASEGQGVALARKRLAAAHFRSGSLVQPFGPALPLGPAYWLVLPARGTPIGRAARVFAAWIRAEAKQG
jgi:LysR family transcriptional regulator, glycine cleavage system transcriptional activator